MGNSYISNRILISLLKKFGIRKLVLSSGARNIPFVNAVETDEAFDCYSVIDERNAAFFGMGLAQQCNEPVAIACTSGTAASNYISGVTEAYYSNVPLVVLTFDRNPYMLNQLETQKIDQMSIFDAICKKNVCLPLIKDTEDIWYCQRLINEALIALNQHQAGPVHINIPLSGDMNALVEGSIDYSIIDNTTKIDHICDDENVWKEKINDLSNSKKILVVIGQHSNMTTELSNKITAFSKKYNCPVLADNLANYRGDNLVFAEAIIKALNSKTIENFLPEYIISFGCNFQERIKDLFKAHYGKFKHWSISPNGEIIDVFKSEAAMFECTPEVFLEKMVKTNEGEHSAKYLAQWKELEGAATLPELKYTNFMVIEKFAKCIPNNSIVHLSILNSTRLMQFFKLDESIKCYSNVNSFGIDGCLPTFMGQAFAADNLAFLVIGDLSFFYGMNAIAIKHRKNNIRILLINNGGGAEFHIQPNSNSIPTIDLHIGAAHNRVAKDWALSMNYKYLSANDEISLGTVMQEFVSKESDKPILLEVFTDMKTDGEYTLEIYRELEKRIRHLI